mmetsp:Transcript_47143/g.93013  ORF Transcript_47143/g.93013 Transcript_47143/m.93013 type:complete len:309 (-) Transcript_47143:196-1122(-)
MRQIGARIRRQGPGGNLRLYRGQKPEPASWTCASTVRVRQRSSQPSWIPRCGPTGSLETQCGCGRALPVSSRTLQPHGIRKRREAASNGGNQWEGYDVRGCNHQIGLSDGEGSPRAHAEEPLRSRHPGRGHRMSACRRIPDPHCHRGPSPVGHPSHLPPEGTGRRPEGSSPPQNFGLICRTVCAGCGVSCVPLTFCDRSSRGAVRIWLSTCPPGAFKDLPGRRSPSTVASASSTLTSAPACLFWRSVRRGAQKSGAWPSSTIRKRKGSRKRGSFGEKGVPTSLSESCTRPCIDSLWTRSPLFPASRKD